MRVLAVLAVIATLAGCGGGDSNISSDLAVPLPDRAVPRLDARDRVLPADVLAADAFEPEELRAILDDGGYLGGRERELSGRGDIFDHVIARHLRFDEPAGAAAYLAWVRTHTLDLVGRTRPLPAPAIGDETLAVELEPCTTCRKQLPTVVVAWRRGGDVGYVLAAGRDAALDTVARLVDAVDQRVRRRPHRGGEELPALAHRAVPGSYTGSFASSWCTDRRAVPRRNVHDPCAGTSMRSGGSPRYIVGVRSSTTNVSSGRAQCGCSTSAFAPTARRPYD